MKKLFLLFIALCTLTVAQAQVVSAYTMQATQGTYTEITDGTVMDLSGLDLTEAKVLTGKAWYPNGIVSAETTAEGFPIGFDFMFNDMTCNQFIIGSHGYIALGKDVITNDPSHKQHIVSRETGADNIIGVMPNVMEGIYANETSEFSYKVIGEAPNRTLVVQFRDWAPCFGWDADGVVNVDMQIRLNETSNTIDFVFGDFIYDGDNEEKNTRFALRGYYKDQVSLVEGEEAGMVNYTAVAGDNQIPFGKNLFTSGLTYTFAPPADCVTPSSHFNYKTFKAKTNSFTIEWDWADFSDADHVLLMLSENGGASPVDGVYYAEGDSLGNALVLAYTTDTIYELPEDIQLEPETTYYLHIHVANSFCSNGPVYDVGGVLPFNTKPAAPAAFEIVETADETITINLTADENNNNIIVVYNTELVRDNRGDYPLIGELYGQYTAGEEIYEGGKVAYAGPAGENIVLTGFEHSKSYFFVAYSYNEFFNYSTETLSAAAATTAHLPYTLDLDAAKTLDLPVGWTKNETGTFQIPRNLTNYITTENPRLLWCNVSKADVTNGVLNQLTSCPIVIDKANAAVKFDFTMYHKISRMSASAYNEWKENDVFAVQVSTDGETFEDLVVYNSTNNPTFVYGEDYSLVPCEGDLAKYEGKTIWIRIHWLLYNNSAFGPGTLVLDNFRIEELIIPATPEVKVNNLAHTSATVTWRGEQENYEVAYAKTGEEFATTVVEGANEYVLTGLEAETEYQVKVRGIVAENDYSPWSEIVSFTTTAWPECDAPINLEATVDGKTVTLSWEGTEEHLSWEVRYRDAYSTSWTNVKDLEVTTLVLEELETEVTYLWAVRAYCTAGRETAWSAQSSFSIAEEETETVPTPPTLIATASNDTVHLAWDFLEGVIYYTLYYGKEKLVDNINVNDTAYAVKVMKPANYCFTVTATNGIGESEHSNEACVEIVADPDLQIPAAPVITASIVNDSAVVTWDEVELATYYEVYLVKEEGLKFLKAIDGTVAKFLLKNQGKYCFVVKAGNLAGLSDASNEDCISTDENPNDEEPDDEEPEEPTVGVSENTASFNIYPNPVNDKLYIETEVEIEEVSIFDVYGRNQNLRSSETQNLSISVDVANLNSGVYFVKVVTNDGEIVKRFVKK